MIEYLLYWGRKKEIAQNVYNELFEWFDSSFTRWVEMIFWTW